MFIQYYSNRMYDLFIKKNRKILFPCTKEFVRSVKRSITGDRFVFILDFILDVNNNNEFVVWDIFWVSFLHYVAEEGTLDINPSLLRLNTVRFLIPVMDDESQLVHFLFSPMYNSSGRIKTANGPQCAQLCSVTAALLSNYFRKK